VVGIKSVLFFARSMVYIAVGMVSIKGAGENK
jgi:hypothetical protein